MKSLMAFPSFRNSGLEATSNGTSIPRAASSRSTVSLTFAAVPTGTVLLVTSSVYFETLAPNVFATSSTWLRSAPPSSSGGVPTAMKTTSTLLTTAPKSVPNDRRPARMFFWINVSSSGS